MFRVKNCTAIWMRDLYLMSDSRLEPRARIICFFSLSFICLLVMIGGGCLFSPTTTLVFPFTCSCTGLSVECYFFYSDSTLHSVRMFLYYLLKYAQINTRGLGGLREDVYLRLWPTFLEPHYLCLLTSRHHPKR